MSEYKSNRADYDDLRETIAALCHEQWAAWMRYLFAHGKFNEYDDTFTINADKVDRWYLQMNTPYPDLSDSEQDSDRIEADKFLALFDALAGATHEETT